MPAKCLGANPFDYKIGRISLACLIFFSLRFLFHHSIELNNILTSTGGVIGRVSRRENLQIAAQVVEGGGMEKEIWVPLRGGTRRCEECNALRLSALSQGTWALIVDVKIAKPGPWILYVTASS